MPAAIPRATHFQIIDLPRANQNMPAQSLTTTLEYSQAALSMP